MKRILPSASALPRSMGCPESNAMAGTVEATSSDAARGNTVHGFMYRISQDGPEGREAALALVPMDDPGRQACEDIDVTRVPRGGHLEPAFAWNPYTREGRLLGQNIGRAYEQYIDRRMFYVGSADFFGLMVDRRGILIDYKTGRPMPARDSWQLKGLAVMAAAVSGVDEIIATHLVVRGSSIFWDTVEWDALQLASFAEELAAHAGALRALPERLEPAMANVVEGEWCKYCPSFTRCPAKVGLVREMVDAMSTGGALAKQTEFELTRQNAAFVWRQLDAYNAIEKRMRQQVEKFAEREPLDLGDGWELRAAPGEAREKVTRPADALKMLELHYDAETARAAAGATKTSILDAVKAWARRTGASLRGSESSALTLFREAGVLEKVEGDVKVREVKAGR